jgi:dCMP deaminase
MNHEHYLAQAIRVAKYSKDPNTQTAALIYKDDELLAADYNRFPNGVNEYEARWQDKYMYIEHAERNAIYRAARLGKMTMGATMYAPYAACHDCARGIIQAGITTLVHYPFEIPERWQRSIKLGAVMLKEALVKVIEVKPEVGTTIRFDGNIIEL